MAIILVLLALALAGLLAYVFRPSRPRRKLPPGPFQLPIIGNLLQIYFADREFPFRAFSKLSRKYGDVLWLRIGSVDTVVLNGFGTIKAALTENEDFLDRINDEWILERSYGKPQGLFSSRVELWKPTRNFSMRGLREAGGFGRRSTTQSSVNKELVAIMRSIDSGIEKHGGIIAPHTLFSLPSLNLGWGPATGLRFDHDDPIILEFLRLQHKSMRAATFTCGLLGIFPWLEQVVPWLFNYNELIGIFHSSLALIKELVQSVKDKGTYRTDPKGLLDLFLQKMESVDTSNGPTIFTEENLICTLNDFLMGSADTTSGTLAYACLWLMLHPDVQERCYQEIVTVVGKDRLPQVKDREILPYVQATILEIHRRSTIAPILPRQVFKDTEFRGFVIPKGTRVMVNTYSAQMDPETWGDPENFRPERFLDTEGNVVNGHKLLTFAVGKRNCPGEAVAEMAVLTILTGIIQNYKLLPIQSGHKYDTDPWVGVTITARPFQIRMQRRSHQE